MTIETAQAVHKEIEREHGLLQLLYLLSFRSIGLLLQMPMVYALDLVVPVLLNKI